MSRRNALVDGDWLGKHLTEPGIVLVEVDEDSGAYYTDHIPAAVALGRRRDLQDPLRRDSIDQAGFEALLSAKGVDKEDTRAQQPDPSIRAYRDEGQLRAVYLEAGLDLDGRDTIVYCRIGERSAHSWFVLHELLDHPTGKNYDGSRVEYGLVGAPVER